jgi:ParB family chromosome partitioning protein
VHQAPSNGAAAAGGAARRIIAIANQKGGVGKTTTAINLATALAACGKKVMIVDIDPQGNASTGLGVDNAARSVTSYDVLINGVTIGAATVPTAVPRMSLVPASMDLAGAEIELIAAARREYRLRDALSGLSEDFDFVLIDCPPSLNLLTLNALVAADAVLVPLQCEFFALEGLSHLTATIERVKRTLNPDWRYSVVTMFDGPQQRRSRRGRRRGHFGKVCDAISAQSRSQAPSPRKPVLYDTRCAGSRAISPGRAAPRTGTRCRGPPGDGAPGAPRARAVGSARRRARSPRRPRAAVEWYDRLVHPAVCAADSTRRNPALADSIRTNGILQPILVRRHPQTPNSFEIVAGERRWRAAQIARLHEVPVIIREIADGEALELALVENVQRQDLSPLEEAEGYRRLIEEFKNTQEDLARRVGKSRSHVANTLRLLGLPEPVKALLEQGRLTAGHARALLSGADPAALAEQVVARGLNVRQTERLVQQRQSDPSAKTTREKDADTVALERDLSALLGLRVTISIQGRGGALTIHYRTLEQLDDVLKRLTQGGERP